MKALRLAPLPRCLHLSPSPPSSTTPPLNMLKPQVSSMRVQSSRTFISSVTPPGPLQTLTATRTLPYPSATIYTIIADVPSYSSFLPYCTASTVTRWSNPDRDGKKWPEEAELRVGWRGIEEVFKSRIYCVPKRVVEAVAGGARTSLSRSEVGHHNMDKEVASGSGKSSGSSSSSNPLNSLAQGLGLSGPSKEPSLGDGMFTHLLSRWTLQPFPYQPPHPTSPNSQEASTESQPSKEHTQVNLAIEFQFQNPVYSAMSGAVADSVAGVLIEAFEKRVRSIVDGPGLERERR